MMQLDKKSLILKQKCFFSIQGNVSLNRKDLKALTFVGEPSTRACSYTTPQQLTLYLGCTLQN